MLLHADVADAVIGYVFGSPVQRDVFLIDYWEVGVQLMGGAVPTQAQFNDTTSVLTDPIFAGKIVYTDDMSQYGNASNFDPAVNSVYPPKSEPMKFSEAFKYMYRWATYDKGAALNPATYFLIINQDNKAPVMIITTSEVVAMGDFLAKSCTVTDQPSLMLASNVIAGGNFALKLSQGVTFSPTLRTSFFNTLFWMIEGGTMTTVLLPQVINPLPTTIEACRFLGLTIGKKTRSGQGVTKPDFTEVMGYAGDLSGDLSIPTPAGTQLFSTQMFNPTDSGALLAKKKKGCLSIDPTKITPSPIGNFTGKNLEYLVFRNYEFPDKAMVVPVVAQNEIGGVRMNTTNKAATSFQLESCDIDFFDV